ncbi:MAG TPA: zinc ribbon domain-containing protein [Thermoanaerobaculia bacterium]|nr:zinc ribbon domain-containing protein [Thermoanaerobaculia bacterium]
MAIREGAWDCPVCGRKKNRGPEKFCGGCGAPRGPEVKFYLPEDAPEVVAAEALKKAQAGPDWVCPYCDADNPADHAFCSGCGAPKDPGAQIREVVERPLGAPPPPPPQLVAPAPPAKGTSTALKKGCGIGCLGLLALAALVFFVGRPKSADLTVTGFHWLRTIAVEELRPVTEQAWEGEVPPGARILGSSREVHHVDRIQTGTRTATRTVSERVQTGTERVQTGTRDLGNGYFEDVYEDRPVYEDRSHEETYQEPVYREQPVYRQRIRYEAEKWVPDREARAEGQDRSPVWPGPNLGTNEREGSRKELYEVLFQDAEGKPVRYQAPNEQVWKSFEEGRTYKAKVRGSGEVVEIEGAPGG